MVLNRPTAMSTSPTFGVNTSQLHISLHDVVHAQIHTTNVTVHSNRAGVFFHMKVKQDCDGQMYTYDLQIMITQPIVMYFKFTGP